MRPVPELAVEEDHLAVVHRRRDELAPRLVLTRPAEDVLGRRLVAPDAVPGANLLHRGPEPVGARNDHERRFRRRVLEADPDRHRPRLRSRALDVGVPVVHRPGLAIQQARAPEDHLAAEQFRDDVENLGPGREVVVRAGADSEILDPVARLRRLRVERAQEAAALALRQHPDGPEVADVRKFRLVVHGRTLPRATDRSRDRLCGRAARDAHARRSRLRARRTLGGRVARRGRAAAPVALAADDAAGLAADAAGAATAASSSSSAGAATAGTATSPACTAASASSPTLAQAAPAAGRHPRRPPGSRKAHNDSPRGDAEASPSRRQEAGEATGAEGRGLQGAEGLAPVRDPLN